MSRESASFRRLHQVDATQSFSALRASAMLSCSTGGIIRYKGAVKVHLVDGTYELFRSHFGAPPARVNDKEVGATRGFLKSMAMMARQKDVTHVACSFDTVIESFRNDLFDGYKTGEGIDPALWAQFPLAERVAHALGFAVWSMIEFEADDGLAAGAARYSQDPRVEQVVICTPDKDMAQCVIGDQIVLWDRRRGIVLNEEGVKEKFGVQPESIPDYLALVGDTADGIPGIPRWGAKSASAVLAEYVHLEAIPRDAADWSIKVRGAKALAENLAAHEEEVILYRTLATLRHDAPIDESVDDLRWQGPRRDELAALCEEIQEEVAL